MMIWKRWGAWRAHLYVGDVAACPYPSLNFSRGIVLGKKPGELAVLTGDALGPHGVPYGPVCSKCLKTFNRGMEKRI